VLATLGYFVAELWHPLYDGKIPAGLAAIGQVPAAGWLQIIAAIGIIELTVGKQDYENKGPGELGEFGQAFNPFKDDPEAFAALQVLIEHSVAHKFHVCILMQEWYCGAVLQRCVLIG
jgi:Chlorophyll A-B binding protein